MSGWRLTLRAATALPLDLAPLLPERLVGLVEREVATAMLRHGNRRVPAGELFALEPAADDSLTLVGTTAACERIGRGMTGGTLRVEGHAGAYLAQGMAGGLIAVAGSAGPLAANAMTGGTLRIRANAGDFLGGSLPGDRHGMEGGVVLVEGDAGDRPGDRMRRGVIAVRGAAGAFAASRMIGGTLVVAGRCGADPGYAMRRGSLVLGGAPANLLCTFADAGTLDQPWLTLLARHLAAHGWPAALPARARRLTGCASAGGQGEILLAA